MMKRNTAGLNSNSMSKRPFNPKFRANKSAQLTISDICKPDANSTTTAIITYLNYNGWHVSRINTHGVYDTIKQVHRKVHGQAKGVPDIVGFNLTTGQYLCIEIKIGSDKLSEEQKYHLDTAKKSGAYVMVASSFDDFLAKHERRVSNE